MQLNHGCCFLLTNDLSKMSVTSQQFASPTSPTPSPYLESLPLLTLLVNERRLKISANELFSQYSIVCSVMDNFEQSCT